MANLATNFKAHSSKRQGKQRLGQFSSWWQELVIPPVYWQVKQQSTAGGIVYPEGPTSSRQVSKAVLPARDQMFKFLRVISVSCPNLCRVSFSSLDGDPLQTGLEWSSCPGLHSSRLYRLRVRMSQTPRIIQPFFSLCFLGFCCFPLSFESRS